jgi:hypothetical protein
LKADCKFVRDKAFFKLQICKRQGFYIKCASFEFPEAIVNDEETDIVSYMDINETNASVTLNQKECGDFFTSKDQLKAIKSEEEKK